MGSKLGTNWYARLQKEKSELEHKLEDTQAHNRALIRKLKNQLKCIHQYNSSSLQGNLCKTLIFSHYIWRRSNSR